MRKHKISLKSTQKMISKIIIFRKFLKEIKVSVFHYNKFRSCMHGFQIQNV